MNWISILDRLPEMTERYDESIDEDIMASEPVLVSKDGNCVMFGYFEETDEGIIFVRVSENYDIFGEYEYELDEISHWMPLPAPAEISNEEWFKRAVVEGLKRRFQREIDKPVEKIDFVIENGVLQKYTGKGGHVVIPDGVTSIGHYAFHSCDSLTSITIPDSVTDICMNAFSRCSSLKEIDIPNSVTSIGWFSFEACTSLTNITIPESVASIGVSAFNGCTALTNLSVPRSVKEIGACAFMNCGSLTSITIPDSVTIIARGMFYKCTSLTSINIPNSVTRIEEAAFVECKSLASIIIPNSVTGIGKEAFRDCTSLRSANVPDSVTSMGENVFAGCTELNKYVFISYSSKNQDYAESMRYLLKQAGINTWMAPYDIPSGSEYADVLNDAVENCNCVLLLLSQASQASPHVRSEIRIAFDAKKHIVSMHIDESLLTPGFKYYLGNQQIVAVKSMDENDPDVQKVLTDIKFYMR